MAQVNPLTREVLIKLVYYGPGLGGKTTTLQRVHAVSPAETRGKIVSLATPVPSDAAVAPGGATPERQDLSLSRTG